jgi:hypothetical protein
MLQYIELAADMENQLIQLLTTETWLYYETENPTETTGT